MRHTLFVRHYPTLDQAFSSVPDDTDVLELSWNLPAPEPEPEPNAQANFDAIVQHQEPQLIANGFDLVGVLQHLTAEQVAVVLAGMQANLGQILDPNPPGEAFSLSVLAEAISKTPPGVKTLCLANNNLGPALVAADLVGTLKLARAVENLSQTAITELDLSNNALNALSPDEMKRVLEPIPSRIVINLKGNHLFDNKTPEEIDAYLEALGEQRGRLDFRNNGESEFARVSGVLAQMNTSGVVFDSGKKLDVPTDIASKVASFFGTKEDEAGRQISKDARKLATRKLQEEKLDEDKEDLGDEDNHEQSPGDGGPR
jgi:hypothetical protein